MYFHIISTLLSLTISVAMGDSSDSLKTDNSYHANTNNMLSSRLKANSIALPRRSGYFAPTYYNPVAAVRYSGGGSSYGNNNGYYDDQQPFYLNYYPRRYAGSPEDENNDGVPDDIDRNRDGRPDEPKYYKMGDGEDKLYTDKLYNTNNNYNYKYNTNSNNNKDNSNNNNYLYGMYSEPRLDRLSGGRYGSTDFTRKAAYTTADKRNLYGIGNNGNYNYKSSSSNNNNDHLQNNNNFHNNNRYQQNSARYLSTFPNKRY